MSVHSHFRSGRCPNSSTSSVSPASIAAVRWSNWIDFSWHVIHAGANSVAAKTTRRTVSPGSRSSPISSVPQTIDRKTG